MHDEAAAHVADMIDQTALGHGFLHEVFGGGRDAVDASGRKRSLPGSYVQCESGKRAHFSKLETRIAQTKPVSVFTMTLFLSNRHGVSLPFGPHAVPRVGWQVDPFGHSAVQASHLGSGVGFEAVFFGRADQDDVDARSKTGAMEFTWRGSPSEPSVKGGGGVPFNC